MPRGTWQGSGTWETSGRGGRRLVLAAAAIIAALGALEWLLARIWWVIAGLAVLAAAVLAVVRWLIRAQQRREAAFGDRLAMTSRREAPALTVTATPQVTATLPPAIEQHVHFHLDPADREALRVIRQALPGEPGHFDEGT